MGLITPLRATGPVCNYDHGPGGQQGTVLAWTFDPLLGGADLI